MSNSKGKISAPVGIEDAVQVLGVTVRDVGYLCSNQHGRINMWSQKKPVHILNSLAPDRNMNWWQGTGKTCGLIIPTTTSYNNIPAMYTADKKNGWGYAPPTGGAASPYRLADFNGYDHNAISPISDYSASEIVVPSTYALFLRLLCSAMPEGSVKLSDIGLSYGGVDNLGDFAFGAVIVNSSGQIVSRGSAKGTECSFDSSLFSYGKYSVYPYLSALPNHYSTTDIPNLYCPIPGVGVKTFESINLQEYYSDVAVMVRATLGNLNTCSGEIRVSLNLTASRSYTFHNNTVQLRYATSNIASPLESGEYEMQLEDFTVSPSGPNYNMPFLFTGLRSTASYIVHAFLDGGILHVQGTPR